MFVCLGSHIGKTVVHVNPSAVKVDVTQRKRLLPARPEIITPFVLVFILVIVLIFFIDARCVLGILRADACKIREYNNSAYDKHKKQDKPSMAT